MLKIPQARLQQYMNHELQDIRLDLEGQRNQRSNCQHPLDHRKSKRVPASTSASLTMPKPLTVWITTHWKILIEMGIPDHLTCLLRNLYAGQEATIRTRHGTTDWFKIGKGVRQSCILSRVYLTYMQSTLSEMLDWMNHKLESRLPGEISITSDMQMTLPLWEKVKKN